MRRAGALAFGTLPIAIGLGFLGAWAFNPDSGAVAHNEALWRIFGVMCAGGAFLLIVVVALVALSRVARRIMAIGHSRCG